METLQTWFTTWVDPRVVGEAVMDWGGRIAGALLIFIVAYIFIFGAGMYYILKLIGKGPERLADKDDKRETYGSHGVETPAIAGDEKGAR